jgi:hypothetical protein
MRIQMKKEAIEKKARSIWGLSESMNVSYSMMKIISTSGSTFAYAHSATVFEDDFICRKSC